MKTTLNFIIADDNPIDKYLHAKIVSELGHQVIALATNGEELVKLCHKHKFDIVLCDTIMPILDGIEASKKIKLAFPDVKIIGTSAFADIAFPLGISNNIFDAYLIKGFSALKLNKVIDNIKENTLFIDPLLSKKLQTQIDDLAANCVELKEQFELVELNKLTKLATLAEGFEINYQGEQIKISEKNIQLVSAIYHSLNREEIAEVLNVCTDTVDQNIKRLKQKFAVQHKMELVKLFIELGLINEIQEG